MGAGVSGVREAQVARAVRQASGSNAKALFQKLGQERVSVADALEAQTSTIGGHTMVQCKHDRAGKVKWAISMVLSVGGASFKDPGAHYQTGLLVEGQAAAEG